MWIEYPSIRLLNEINDRLDTTPTHTHKSGNNERERMEIYLEPGIWKLVKMGFPQFTGKIKLNQEWCLTVGNVNRFKVLANAYVTID